MLSEQLSLHQRVPDAVGLAAELQEPPVVHDAVYHGRGHLVVPEDRAPPGELEVGREHDRLRLVGLGDHLEEQPRPVGVEREEAQLVYDQELGPAELGELAVEPSVVAGAAQAHHERGGREEPGGPCPLAGERAERLRHVRLARADVAHEHEVLATVQEREREQVVLPKPSGHSICPHS